MLKPITDDERKLRGLLPQVAAISVRDYILEEAYARRLVGSADPGRGEGVETRGHAPKKKTGQVGKESG